ncbi:hypothetical protein V5P93_001426 [Actinokineospora auranticolor]|uniref:Uncharacterized protein n=1 Tax=Actinokineospora auranticolor TaxID=155976 RepID=A0A2S6GV14_9PSEU|nr:hypothetical protein [Actinokineospora auranticolor]PPK69050.1 hypothetical protein CLV40_104300 [Actinokineospora auranticolor]
MQVTAAPIPEDELTRQIAEVTAHFAPRRFAVYQVQRDTEGQATDFVVLGWGMEIADGAGDDYVELFGMPDAQGVRTRGQFRTAESASHVLGGNRQVEFRWIDTESD